ncbi:MAG: hypothetical protein F6K40_09930 [Okeania sp. SIO3I5]|uniref:DUF5615 family PIN-like protein n=1 Tax=Okeania sp. SIO3I5 TaxID=2607805 RepID=UPI0013BDC3AC|nr:DUF5615 family PIN-like protein [Okeania sp. SIO3I5]NEQ36575.1 hypothetical protein [Okeania sp. SIO3I5]
MAYLYADEQFPLPVVQIIRGFDHNILTVQEAEKEGDSDAEVLAFAVKNNRAVLTLNRRHFIKLHIQKPNHCGIIVCTEDRDIKSLGQRINQAIYQQESLVNKLIRVNRPQQ